MAAAQAPHALIAVALLSLCLAAEQFTDPIYWAAAIAVAGRHSSAACGVMNTGGNVVGGAGHIYLDRSGEVERIELNFSGHYRPHLTAGYARYVYRAIAGHPLLRLSPSCSFAGRVFKGLDAASSVVEFTADELRSDDPELDRTIEGLFL